MAGERLRFELAGKHHLLRGDAAVLQDHLGFDPGCQRLLQPLREIVGKAVELCLELLPLLAQIGQSEAVQPRLLAVRRPHRGREEPYPDGGPGPGGDRAAVELLHRPAGPRRRGRGRLPSGTRDARGRDAGAAYRAAARGATVVLGLPLEVQRSVTEPWSGPVPAVAPTPGAAPEVEPLLAALQAARRPVFIAGRGARAAREPLIRLADACGALLAVSAAAKGLFAGDPWNLDVAGGFATPLAAELIGGADLVVAWGSTLNMWTTRHGELIPPDAPSSSRSTTTRPRSG